MPANHYEVLNISPPSVSGDRPLTPAALKAAYHRALLQHHPDKNPSLQTASSGKLLRTQSPLETQQKQYPRKAQESHVTVDEITLAYTTLSSTKARAEYDRELRLRPFPHTASPTDRAPHATSYSGLENVDLDDLSYDASAGLWWKKCRCETTRAFVVTEKDLEKAIGEFEETGNKENTAEIVVPRMQSWTKSGICDRGRLKGK